MLTMKCILDKKYHPDIVLTDYDKRRLIEENQEVEYSYLCLLKEQLAYKVTVRDLLKGWCGVSLFKI